MENTANLKKKRPLFVRLARWLFALYMITLYIFVDRAETLIISKLAFLLYAGFCVLVILQRKRLHIGKNMLVVYMTLTWMYTTSFWAKHEYLASEKMNTMWQVFILFFLTYNIFCEEEDAHEYLMKSLYISGIVLVVYSIYTYGFSQVISMMSQQGGIRIGREINQENTFGMYNATTVIVAFYYLFYRKRYKLFHIPMIAISFLFAMSSGSRKALLMICFGVLFLIYKRYGIKKLYKVVIITAILIFVFMMVIKLPIFNLINRRLELAVEMLQGESIGDGSARTRFKMISDGWEIFKERLLIGYGANNYAYVSGYWTYAHNNFIEILVDFGLIGFILYYLAYAFAMNNLLKSKKDAGKALLAIFLVRFFMEIALVTYYSKQHWILLAFFLISDRKVHSSEKVKEEEFDYEQIEEEFEEKPENIRDAIKEFLEEEKDDTYESEKDCEETEETYYEPEDCPASFVGE